MQTLLYVAQEQPIRMSYIILYLWYVKRKGKTLKCEKLVYHKYKKLYDTVASLIHWNLCEKHGIEKRRKLAQASPRKNDREQWYQNI